MAYEVILATTREGGIGLNGSLPWDYPEDLAFFKKNTVGKRLVCAYDTYVSLPEVVKKRVYMVQSRQYRPELVARGIMVVANITHKYLSSLLGSIIIIGGKSLFTSAILSNADYVHHTLIHKEYECDTYIDMLILEYKMKNSVYIINNQTKDLTIRSYHGELSKTNSNCTTDGIA